VSVCCKNGRNWYLSKSSDLWSIGKKNLGRSLRRLMDHGRFKWGRKKPLVPIFKMTTMMTTVVMLVISCLYFDLDPVNSEVMNYILSMPLLCRLKYCTYKLWNTDYKIYALKPWFIHLTCRFVYPLYTSSEVHSLINNFFAPKVRKCTTKQNWTAQHTWDTISVEWEWWQTKWRDLF
jgi:hypothetical protein